MSFILNTEYKTFHDEIHGYMKISNLACRFIDHKYFQRLRKLKQLGTCDRVFHTASHTRFDHLIGTYSLATKLLDCITTRTKPDTIADYLKSIPELQDYYNRTYSGMALLDKYVCELIKIAALTHDIGHGPFSHVFDDVFLPSVKQVEEQYDLHEERSGLLIEHIIKNDPVLKDIIKPSEIQFIRDVINPKEQHTGFLYQIVSNYLNGLDVDKYDYIMRDSAKAGIGVSFNADRLTNDAYVVENTICYPKQTIYDAFRLYQSRYDMHKSVYTHKMVLSSQFMIAELMTILDPILKISESVNDPDKFAKMTDSYILECLETYKSADINLSDEKKELIKKADVILERWNTHNLYVFIDNFTSDKKIPITIEDFKKLETFDPKYQDDILIFQSRIGYVSGNKSNPFDNMFVCSPKNNTGEQKLEKIKKTEISHFIPQVYQEFITLVFYKVRGDSEGEKKIKAWFAQLIG